ncbi:Sugar lactone lactonase YvrE [Rubritalea squalenifaciens DSM 18772]|uniref:Sugar lactone lactonase YvrE n=2 Tax=Rubritalea squalenifaciens TaxID=407226 RepID=A0A1M6HRU0_9BACT|nr:Sugar lactone lactonase YvrE [Rubritalea squalenifaciens DSM 18772]
MDLTMIQVEPIGDYRAQWGEGAIWWKNALLYVDIEKHKVIKFDPVSGEEKFWDVGERVGTVVPRESGGMVIAGDNGFYFLSEDGELTSISDPEPDKADNRFNDGKCSPDGHFFAGTISLVKKTGDAKLYRLSKNGEVTEAFGPVTNSNGLAWSKDGKTMFYIDTPRREIFGFDYAEGSLSNMVKVADTGHIDASPDGMAIDENDNLWVAFCHGACVVCFDSKTGEEIQRVEVPCLETTSCAFGGGNLDELYVTTGIHKSEVEEHAGRLFKVTGLGVKGANSFAFGG